MEPSARADGARHFRHSRGKVRNEVEHQRGHYRVARCRFDWKAACIADVEPDSRITDLLPRESQIALRRVDSVDLRGIRSMEDRLG